MGGITVTAGQRACLGHQTIIGLSTSTPATLTVPTGAICAEIQADGGVVKIRLDGGAPTATVGLSITDSSVRVVDTQLVNVQLLAVAGSTNVNICYFDTV